MGSESKKGVKMGEKRRLLRVLVRFIVSSSSIPLSVDFKP